MNDTTAAQLPVSSVDGPNPFSRGDSGQATMANSLPVVIASDQSLITVTGGSSVIVGAAAAYRGPLTLADVLSPPTLGATSAVAGGSLTAGSYNNKILAGNLYGRTTATAGTVVVTATTNLTARIPITQVTGAGYYDVYVSVDADPKWVARITESQRAAGCLVTAVGTVGAGGVAGAVDVQVPGTGLQSLVVAAQNTAYVVPAATVNCGSSRYVDFDLALSRSGDGVAPALTVIPFFYDANQSLYFAGVPITPVFGGGANAYSSLNQRVRVECRGNPALALVVANLAGTGVSLTISSTLS